MIDLGVINVPCFLGILTLLAMNEKGTPDNQNFMGWDRSTTFMARLSEIVHGGAPKGCVCWLSTHLTIVPLINPTVIFLWTQKPLSKWIDFPWRYPGTLPLSAARPGRMRDIRSSAPHRRATRCRGTRGQTSGGCDPPLAGLIKRIWAWLILAFIWLVVSNMFFPFHIWDNPSHWLIIMFQDG